MTFDDILAQIIDVLQRQGRMSYGAIKRRYDLDDAYLEPTLSSPTREKFDIVDRPHPQTSVRS
jgi:hypothetical protein